MRYWTTTKPPAGMAERYGLRISHAPPVAVPAAGADPADLASARNAAWETMRRILAKIEGGSTGVVLRHVCSGRTDFPQVLGGGRSWWAEWAKHLATELVQLADHELQAIGIDHATYPGRRMAEEVAWQREEIVQPILKATHEQGTRVGMYGHPKHSPTAWHWPWALAERVEQLYGPQQLPFEWDERALAWCIMPGQYRNHGGPPTTAEFISVLEWLRASGCRDVLVWSDPRDDDNGRPKTRPQDWHALLVAAAIMEGRRVTVHEYDPPAWLAELVEQRAG